MDNVCNREHCKWLRLKLRPTGNLNHLCKETSWFYTLLQDTVFPYMAILTKWPITHCHVSNTISSPMGWSPTIQGSVSFHRLLSTERSQVETNFSVLPCASPCCRCVPQPVAQFYPISPHRTPIKHYKKEGGQKKQWLTDQMVPFQDQWHLKHTKNTQGLLTGFNVTNTKGINNRIHF